MPIAHPPINTMPIINPIISNISPTNITPATSNIISDQWLTNLKIIGLVALILVACIGIIYLIYWLVNRNSSTDNTAQQNATPASQRLQETMPPKFSIPPKKAFLLDDLKEITVDNSALSIAKQLDLFTSDNSKKPIRGKIYANIGKEDEYIELIYNKDGFSLEKDKVTINKAIVLLISTCTLKNKGTIIGEMMKLTGEIDQTFLIDNPKGKLQFTMAPNHLRNNDSVLDVKEEKKE